MCSPKSKLNCLQDEFEFQGSCVKTCPKFTYPHVSTQMCKYCPNGCETCIDYNNCLACTWGYNMDNIKKECYPKIYGCIQSSSRSKCDECQTDLTLKNGNCYNFDMTVYGCN